MRSNTFIGECSICSCGTSYFIFELKLIRRHFEFWPPTSIPQLLQICYVLTSFFPNQSDSDRISALVSEFEFVCMTNRWKNDLNLNWFVVWIKLVMKGRLFLNSTVDFLFEILFYKCNVLSYRDKLISRKFWTFRKAAPPP